MVSWLPKKRVFVKASHFLPRWLLRSGAWQNAAGSVPIACSLNLWKRGSSQRRKRKRRFSTSRNAFGPRGTPKKSNGWARNLGRWSSVGRCRGLNNGANFPKKLRQHLIQRMADRSITIGDLNQLRLWVDSNPEVPEGEWYKDFGSFKVCGEGPYPKTFLLPGQPARGVRL